MVGYNPNITFAAPEAGPATVSAAASTSAGARPRADTAASIGTSVGATLIAQGGHRVTFLQNNGSWQAEVDENLPVGFSRKLHLPVYIEKGMHWQQLASFSEAIQRQRVAVDFTPGRGYVYIGSRGLRGGNAQSLHAAVDQGYLAQVRKILKKGKTNINAVNEQEQSALHRAVIKGHKEIAALLLEAGADTALQDHQGKRALDYADEDDRSYFSTIASVVQLFSTLDDLIAADLSAGGSQKQDEIEQKLSEVLSQLGELEAEETQGQEQYRHFKYRYHAFKISYYKALGNEARASSNEKLAEKYEEPNTTVLLPLPPDEEEQEALEAKITAKTDEARSSTEDAKRQEILGEIREDILPGSACAKIEALVAEACRAPGNFDGYIKISATRENFERRMHEAIVNCAAAQAGEQAQEIDRRRRKRLLAGLATLVHSAIDQNRLAFIQNALDCSEELRELFFTNLLLTEENISRRYGELTQEFHPDKAKWIPEAYQSTARDLMALITACRDGLMQNLQTAAAASGKYTFYQKLRLLGLLGRDLQTSELLPAQPCGLLNDLDA